MKTITNSYTETNPEATLQRAKMLTYKERIMDESQLVDGKIPMVQAKNEDGTPRVEMDIEWDIDMMNIISETPRVDADGNEIPVMVQKDITIPNPQTPLQFMADRAQENMAEFMVEGVKKQIMDAAKLQAEQIIRDAETQVEVTKMAVKDSIVVTIA